MSDLDLDSTPVNTSVVKMNESDKKVICFEMIKSKLVNRESQITSDYLISAICDQAKNERYKWPMYKSVCPKSYILSCLIFEFSE